MRFQGFMWIPETKEDFIVLAVLAALLALLLWAIS